MKAGWDEQCGWNAQEGGGAGISIFYINILVNNSKVKIATRDHEYGRCEEKGDVEVPVLRQQRRAPIADERPSGAGYIKSLRRTCVSLPGL